MVDQQPKNEDDSVRKERKISVFTIDDHAILRETLSLLIDDQPDMCSVGGAPSVADAEQRGPTLKPDVVLLDISMPEAGGLVGLGRIRKAFPAARVLILSMHNTQTYLHAALASGAAGYVVKQSSSEQLLLAIREIHAGRSFFNVMLDSSDNASRISQRSAQGKPLSKPLSKREAEVLQLLALGFTNSEVGDKLEISKKSVDTIRSRIYQKLGFSKRSELVRYALKCGLLGGRPD